MEKNLTLRGINRCTYVCTKRFDVFATLPNYGSCILKTEITNENVTDE